MNDDLRRRILAWGSTLDSMMDDVAASMGAVGHRSRRTPGAGPDTSGDGAVLRAQLVDLGLVCMRMAGEWEATAPEREPVPDNVLDIYASARRLIALFRLAEESHALTSRAAAELDGDIDTVEEHLVLLSDPAGMVDAVHSLADCARPYLDSLPEPLTEEFRRLATYLP